MSVPVGNIVQVTVAGTAFSQVWSNVYTYGVVVWPAPVTAVQAAEAFWSHVKAVYRALMPSGWPLAFTSVSLRDLTDPLGAYAVYGIPTAERAGTRSAPAGGPVPPFMAVGARLNVGSRVTRPGQKRFPGMFEADVDSEVANSAFVTLVGNILAVTTVGIVLGAPAATVALDPVVTKLDPATGAVLASQEITSYTINPVITTQNTRKIGRGV